MKTRNHKYQVVILSMFLIAGLLGITGSSWALDDDVPFFAGATGAPNILFIFDNSDSMQNVPLLRDDGNILRPSGWRWRQGVMDDNNDGIIDEDVNGNVVYDQSKHISEDEEMPLPGRLPPDLPGLGTTAGDITSIPGDSSDLIYDSNVDWSLVADWGACAYGYRYWKVKVTDGNGAEQIKNLYHCYTSGYWRVYGTIDYTGPEPYRYEIMSSVPGEATYVDTSNLNLIYDSNFDWSTVDTWSEFEYGYRYKIIEITAGTNEGERRIITGRSSSYGYWVVDQPFPVPCDYSTRYAILGSAGDDRQASGGNHPDSKLYQAKKALTTFLDSDKLWVCDEEDGEGNCIQKRYLVNMGFATYMSARVPRVYAKYYRKRAGATTTVDERYYISGYYRRTTNHSTYEYHPTSNSEFDDDWGGHHTGVTVGYEFDRLYQEGQCNEQIITYTVTSIVHSPTDSLPNRYLFYFNGDYVQYSWRNTDVGSCVEGSLDVGDLPDLEPNWTVVNVDDPCFENQNPQCIHVDETTTTTDDWYQLYTYRDTYGDWSVADPATPRYIDPLTLQVTPYKGYCDGSWSCTDPDPEPVEGDGDWTLVTEANAKYDVPINANGDLGDIIPNTYDLTHFRYPGITGDANHPHAWSYRKTDESWVYRYAHSYSSNWGDGMAGQGGFPGTVGDEMANRTGDDQVVFVNLPAYDDADAHKGDDINGTNITKIKNYASLTRVQHPRHGYENYDLTMMPYTSSIASNYYTAQTGKGTPLAASLLNTKTYYESYFAQDQFTIGDCRKNYVILLTDGLETCDGDPVAASGALNTQLISGNPGSVVKTFVIGFGLDEASKANLNAIAAAGGTTEAYFATNVEELVNILANEITAAIIGDSYSRSSPVASRYFEGGDELKLYYAYFDYPVWKGHLNSYDLNYDGTLGDPVAGWTSDCDGKAGNDGDAGCEISTHGRGTVYTVADTSTMAAIPFSTANVDTLKPLINPDGEDINENGTADEDADAEAVINYTLNPGHDGSKYLGSRDAGWPLGDIYHSAPVIVTKPKFSVSYWDGYDAYKATQTARPTMIYIGANDGMLHGIQDSNGQEAWAYIPNCILGKLHEFKEGHRFTVDLTIRGAEVDTSDGCDGTGWKAMVVSGLRQGGSHYYAVDVTDPATPAPMWETTDYTDDGDSTNDNMGNTWSTPSFGRVKINNIHTFVIFVGGGLSDSEDKGNRLYIIKAADGTILKEITVGGPTNNVPSEIKVLRYQTNQAGQPVDYSTGATVSSDLKGNIEVAYFGGTDGTLYKLTELNTQNQWDPQLEVLYRPPAAERRPIYHRPAVAENPSCHKRFILFGTGNENDPTTVTQNYFCEIEDRPWDDVVDGAHEPEWTEEQKTDGLFRLTWKETLTPIGEEVLSDPTYYSNAVYFTAYQPQGGCDMGLSYLYGITTSTCTGTGGDTGLQFDEDGNPLGEDDYEKKQELGKSIATSPVLAPPGMFIGDGDDVIEVPIPAESGILLYWREGN